MTPEDPFTFIYTSGTTGPPKGCVLTHGNYRQVVTMLESAGAVQEDEVIYLFLPLAHAYALLIQLVNFDIGTTIAYFGGDSTQIVPELQQVQPTYLPSVPRIFEKIYTLALSSQPAEVQEQMQAAAKLGVKVRDLQIRGEEVPPELLAPFEAGRGAALQQRPRDLRRPPAPGGQRRRARSPRRSSSSSTAAACPCSRATA